MCVIKQTTVIKTRQVSQNTYHTSSHLEEPKEKTEMRARKENWRNFLATQVEALTFKNLTRDKQELIFFTANRTLNLHSIFFLFCLTLSRELKGFN